MLRRIKGSGTTCVAVLIKGSKLVTANIGDSRCIAFRTQGPLQTCKQLTVDHKPWVKEERARILAKGGVVTAAQGRDGTRTGPERVWSRGGQGPGLAMSRSIGDLMAKQAGVASEPGKLFVTEDVEEHSLAKDKYEVIILASDGIWDALSNEEVGSIVLPFYGRKGNPESAAKRLVEAAHSKWISKGTNVDDITVIVIFLDYLTNKL